MPAEKIPGWIERLLLPKLSEMSGDIKAINVRIDSLESNINTRMDSIEDKIASLETNMNIKIDSLRNETKTEIVSVRTEISGMRTEMTVRLDSLEKRIPVIEEITALKLKIADLEKKFAMA